MNKLILLVLMAFSLNCKVFQPTKDVKEADEVEQFASEIASKIEALYIEDHEDDFLKPKAADKEERKEGKEYIKYYAERSFPGRLISVQVNEIMVGSRKYYRVTVTTKAAMDGRRSIEKIEMRQEDIKSLMEKLHIALRKVL